MTTHAITRLARALGAVVIAALLQAGCAATHNVARDLTVTNQPDSFEMHVGELANFTHRFTYDWTTTGTKATVRQACNFTNGVALLEIRDAAGRVVHDKNLREVGSFITAEGKPGVWKIKVTLEEAAGNLTFLVQKNG